MFNQVENLNKHTTVAKLDRYQTFSLCLCLSCEDYDVKASGWMAPRRTYFPWQSIYEDAPYARPTFEAELPRTLFSRRFRQSVEPKFSSVTLQRYQSRLISGLPLLKLIRYLLHSEMQGKNKINKKRIYKKQHQQQQKHCSNFKIDIFRRTVRSTYSPLNSTSWFVLTCRWLFSSTLFPTRTINGFLMRPNLSFCANSIQSGTLSNVQQFVTSKHTRMTWQSRR